MIVSYTNNTSIRQVIYDQYGMPQLAEPGVTITYSSDETFRDIATLIFKTITVGGVTYTGYAQSGTLEAQAGWAVFRSRTVGDVMEKLWSGGKFEFRSIWNNYLTLSYS